MAERIVFFADAADARAYLRELGGLWLAWIVGLGILFFNNGWLVLIGGLAVVVVLLVLVRPLQDRVAHLIPENQVIEGGGRFSGKMTTRDRLLRDFVYGSAPIRVAIEMSAAGRWWLIARHVVLALTVVAFVAVLASF